MEIKKTSRLNINLGKQRLEVNIRSIVFVYVDTIG